MAFRGDPQEFLQFWDCLLVLVLQGKGVGEQQIEVSLPRMRFTRFPKVPLRVI